MIPKTSLGRSKKKIKCHRTLIESDEMSKPGDVFEGYVRRVFVNVGRNSHTADFPCVAERSLRRLPLLQRHLATRHGNVALVGCRVPSDRQQLPGVGGLQRELPGAARWLWSQRRPGHRAPQGRAPGLAARREGLRVRARTRVPGRGLATAAQGWRRHVRGLGPELPRLDWPRGLARGSAAGAGPRVRAQGDRVRRPGVK